LTAVRVNRKGADRVASGHPWIFSSDVIERGGATPGAVVQVVDHKGRAIGIAHYSSKSQICLRLLGTRVEEVDAQFYERRLVAALKYRGAELVGRTPWSAADALVGPGGVTPSIVSESDAYRLVHAEADLLPALIVDRYGDYLAVQTLDQGMDRAKDWIVAGLINLLSPKGIVLRNDAAVRRKEDLPLETVLAHGEIPPAVPVRINGLQFHADLLEGQKTGIFLDQRENYVAAARYASGKALDCFTSTGGFALHLAAKCESVEAVDSSAEALATAELNRQANGIANVEFREANVFDLLAGYSSARREFSIVILDPPAFAKTRGTLEGAARGYKEINLRALRLLGQGGVLVTCSCSHHMSEAMLLEIVAAASLDAGRNLRVLERRTQSQDHPILLTVPETHYLKCLILQVV
jgi:23S rRNA (cytosine1962-C5)-methyltransferase